jgi:hypothetical protein
VNKNLTLGLCVVFMLAGCSAPAATPAATAAPAATLAPLPTYTPYPTYTPAPTVAVSAPQLSAPVATLVLTDTAQMIRVNGLSGPDIQTSGVWRFYDQEAQVVCYVYKDTEGTGGIGGVPFQALPYSGMSCLPINQTALGK